MERKIGEIFEYNGEWYQCVKGGCCNCCDLLENGMCVSDFSLNGSCFSYPRKDKTNVLFKKLEKVGEPITVKGRTFQKLVSDDDSCENCVFNVPNKACCKTSYIEGPCDAGLLVEIKQNEENMKEKKLKPFSIEAAKAGKPVCTRDGRKARIICFDSKNDLRRPIVALVEYNGNELLYEYTVEGKDIFSHISTTGTSDLMMLPEKKEGWMNLYKRENECICENECNVSTGITVYTSESEAKRNINKNAIYFSTIKINWEE